MAYRVRRDASNWVALHHAAVEHIMECVGKGIHSCLDGERVCGAFLYNVIWVLSHAVITNLIALLSVLTIHTVIIFTTELCLVDIFIKPRQIQSCCCNTENSPDLPNARPSGKLCIHRPCIACYPNFVSYVDSDSCLDSLAVSFSVKTMITLMLSDIPI